MGNKLLLFILCIFNFNQSNTIINHPYCKNCLYFKKSINNIDYTTDYICTKFLYHNNTTGNALQESTLICRLDENKCGIDGKWFVVKSKKMDYYLQNNRIFMCFLVLTFICKTIFH